MQITEEKNALRREIRALRAALPEGYLARAGAGIAGAVAACPEYRAARTVMGFVSTPEEADLRPLQMCIRDRADAGGTAALNISLIRTLLRQEPAGLFFSLSCLLYTSRCV